MVVKGNQLAVQRQYAWGAARRATNLRACVCFPPIDFCLRVVALVGTVVLHASATAAGVSLPDPLQLGDVTRIALR
jgi:hypothetical protein